VVITQPVIRCGISVWRSKQKKKMVPIKTINKPGMNCHAVEYGRLFLGFESIGESSVMMFVLAP
jgi:hypothetical protein